MSLADLVSVGSGERTWSILLAATAAGLANAIALILINAVAQAPETANVVMFLSFALAAVTFLFAAQQTARRMNRAIEGALHSIRIRLIEKIERADLARIERIGPAEILDRITHNVTVISDASNSVASLLQSASVFVFSVVYLLWLSPAAFVLIGCVELGALYLYRSRRGFIDRLLKEHAAARVRFLDAIMDLLKGAKEIKLSHARRIEVVEDFTAATVALRDIAVERDHALEDNLLFMNSNLYVLLGAIVFVLPQHVEITPALLSKLVAAVLFIWGSVQAALGGYPQVVGASHALVELSALEEKLDGAAQQVEAQAIGVDPWDGTPGRIEAMAIEYEYPGDGHGIFRIGPINLTIEPGEILFIVGGNGTGKSTFLKVLTGLYTPTQGTLKARGFTVLPWNAVSYRELFSSIFSDFHLFSKVYGLLDADPEAVQVLLQQMQIEHKTSFRDGRFTRRDLSTGQRKRLAMIVALLEDRPIFVLDEWAADQDPEFRRYFYEEMLPSLKRRGKTVIAVSHDDRYFHCADRVVIMGYGGVRSIQKISHRSPTASAVVEEN